MKTILVLTDFSINADYTAHYALKFAQKIKADLLLCNIYQLPADEQGHSDKKWPLKIHEENSVEELGDLLARLKTQLDKGDESDFRPEINQFSKEGLIADTINDIVSSQHIFMAVISMHRSNYLTSFLTVDHVWAIIKKANFPLLIIPYQVRYKDYKTIAFATDLNSSDLPIINSLLSLASYSAAEIVLTNVSNKNLSPMTANEQIARFFKQDDSIKNNPRINYHSIKKGAVRKGLTEFTREAEIDMMVLVKRPESAFNLFLKHSIIHELADHSTKPLLIFPDPNLEPILPVF